MFSSVSAPFDPPKHIHIAGFRARMMEKQGRVGHLFRRAVMQQISLRRQKLRIDCICLLIQAQIDVPSDLPLQLNEVQFRLQKAHGIVTGKRHVIRIEHQKIRIIQSFAPGEIEPDAALQFGMEFIGKYLGNRYEGVAAVHTDKAHVHVHMIFNSVSFIDGRKYHAARGEYLERIRGMCDEQCRAWGLSVIDGDFTVRKTAKDEVRSKSQGKSESIST